jgi:antitoxin component YwqK of YwqJK toxin-antitoxin module
MYLRSNIQVVAIVSSIFFFIACAPTKEEAASTQEVSYCECQELFFDDDYNYFYLNDRTLPFTGKCQEKNANEVVLVEKNFEKGKLTGDYLEFYDSGVLKNEWHFLNNRQHGNQKLYDEFGKLSHHSIYHKGELDSIVFSVYPIIK